MKIGPVLKVKSAINPCLSEFQGNRQWLHAVEYLLLVEIARRVIDNLGWKPYPGPTVKGCAHDFMSCNQFLQCGAKRLRINHARELKDSMSRENIIAALQSPDMPLHGRKPESSDVCFFRE